MAICENFIREIRKCQPFAKIFSREINPLYGIQARETIYSHKSEYGSHVPQQITSECDTTLVDEVYKRSGLQERVKTKVSRSKNVNY